MAMGSSAFASLVCLLLFSDNVYRISAQTEPTKSKSPDYSSVTTSLTTEPEEVLGCKVLDETCKQADAKCVLAEDEPDKATCDCNVEGLVFDKDTKKCMSGSCEKSEDCQAEGEVCYENKVCACKDGYGGKGCKEVLGCKELDETCKQADAKCVFAKDEPNKATCVCNVEGLVFDKGTKKCMSGSCEKNEDCQAEGEVCYESKVCACKDGYGGKGCKEVLGCKVLDETCKQADAKCVLAEDEPDKATCDCNVEGSVFDKATKNCLVDKCRDICGVALGTDGDVVCTGDPYGEANVSCQCKEKGKEFVAVTKDCKVNKCSEKCGVSSEKGIIAECSGDPFGEETVTCFCKGEKMEFSPEEKRCKRIEGLSNLAIAAIALTVIVVIVLTVSTVIYRSRRKSKTPRYSIRFQEQTISFENTLYGSTSDHPAFED